MVADIHPHEIELFEYVEGELPHTRRDEIAAHLAACDACTEQVGLAVAGRRALQGTELLQLPDARREEILRDLLAQDRVRSSGERRAFFPRVLFAGVAVLLVVAAFTAVLITSGGNSGQESSAGGTGGSADAAATAAGGGAESAEAANLFATGSPADVADDLRRKGFDALVQADKVVVHGATKAQVREALADRGPGDVEVVVKNP